MTSTIIDLSRWSLGGYARQYDWPQCRYCGRAQEHDCPPVDCLLCGSRQCFGNGSTCRLCLHGWVPGWSHGGTSEATRCGYRGCDEPAVAYAPRVKRVCKAHADRAKVSGQTLTAYVAARMAERDAGKLAVGWERWRWVA